MRSHIEASRLQAGVLLSIRNEAAATYKELRGICTGMDYVTDMSSILDPVSHNDADSGRWSDADEMPNSRMIGLVRNALRGIAGSERFVQPSAP